MRSFSDRTNPFQTRFGWSLFTLAIFTSMTTLSSAGTLFPSRLFLLGQNINLNVQNNIANQYNRERAQAQARQVALLQEQFKQSMELQKRATAELPQLTAKAQEAKAAHAKLHEELKGQEEELQASKVKLREVEDTAVASAEPGSALKKAEQKLDDAVIAQDQVIRKILNLPAAEKSATRQDLLAEQTKLTVKQKTQLKTNPDHVKAAAVTATATSLVNAERKKFLESHPDWKAAKESTDAAQQTLKQSTTNERAAARDKAMAEKKVAEANQVIASVENQLTVTRSQLATLGAAPAVTP